MAVDERSRKRMHDALERRIGADEAATLMEHLPPVGWTDVATKNDLRQSLDALRGELRAEIHRVARTQLLAFAGIMTAMNTALFAALRLT